MVQTDPCCFSSLAGCMRVSPNTSALLTLLISSAVPCSEVLLQEVQLVLGHVGHVVLEVPTVVPRSEVGVSESQTGHLRPLLVHASIGGEREPPFRCERAILCNIGSVLRVESCSAICCLSAVFFAPARRAAHFDPRSALGSVTQTAATLVRCTRGSPRTYLWTSLL